jgi:hypothetical protein
VNLLKKLNPFVILNSVPLGISLMVLTAFYIAVGSGRPWLREYGVDTWSGLRYWFDLTDLQFFDSWPLKMVMGLLIANLVVVTWKRIPLTPPRYGVWCVHIGIITLILGTSFYYKFKLEGRVRLYTDPSTGLNTADHYYDKDERSLYMKVGSELVNAYPLPLLPKFKEYDASLGNVDDLAQRGLTNISATMAVPDDASGKIVQKNISELMGWKDPLRFDIVGYYPYAEVITDFVEDPTSKTSGVFLSMPAIGKQWWLVAADPRVADFPDAGALGIDLQQVTGDAAMVTSLTDAVGKIFKLDVKVATPGGKDQTQTLYVQVGKTYPIGQSSYQLTIENYNPDWPMFGTGEMVKAMTMKITSPTQTFRRMVLDGKPLQTDFKLGVDGAPPIGKRQKEPLDNTLTVNFTVNDPFQLLPREGTVKHTLVTTADTPGMIDVVAGYSIAGRVDHFADGTGDIEISPPDETENAPFAQMGNAPAPDAAAAPPHPTIKLHAERRDHLQADDSVRIVPPARRDRDAADEGIFQVAKVKVSMGAWSSIVIVPIADQATEASHNDGVTRPWLGGTVQLPGIVSPLQLQLGFTYRPLPAKLTLDNFEVIPYPGGKPDSIGPKLDFRSTVTLDDNASGDRFTDVAHMNHPIYFHSGDWLFFQASYDAQHQKPAFTELGVGNRPGVDVMILGCVLIFIGLMYAFYAKPIIIRRMKQRAIEKAQAAGKLMKARSAEELVSSN